MTTAGQLAHLAGRVRPYLPPDRLLMLDEALSRAQSGRVRILVLGEAKRGKSTLVNTLFGRGLLPTGALPVTSVATTVTVASTVDAEVRYRDGHGRAISLGDVAELVSEQGNPSNVRNVDTVRITAPSPFLPDGTEVVDSPGTGSVHQANTGEAARARASVDLAVLVVAADPPVSQAELVLATDVMTTAAAAAVLVNKTDLVRPEDVAEIVEFTRAAFAELLDIDVPVLPVSLRTSAPMELIGWLAERIARQGEADAVASTGRALRREAAAALEGLRIEHELLGRTTEDSARAIQALRVILDHAHGVEAAAIDHLHGETRRARVRLDASHDRAVDAARAAARRLLGPELPDEPVRPEAAADELRRRLNERAAGSCAQWFHHVGTELQAALRDAAEQARSELTAELARARSATAGVLDLRLAEVPAPGPMAAPRLPGLELGPDVAWRELVTTVLAHHLPAPIRRKRLHQHLADWAEGAVPRPFGRARSALQNWLEETRRGTERTLAEIWRDHLTALEAALDEADRGQTGAPEAHLGELSERIEVLGSVVRELDTTPAPVR